MSDIQAMYRRMPPVTKYFFTSAVLLGAISTFKLIDAMSLVYLPEQVFRFFQIWRIPTSMAFFGSFSMSFVFQMFILLRYTRSLEDGYYRGNKGTADLFFMTLFATLIFIIAASIFPIFILGPALSFFYLYIWSRKNPEQPVEFWTLPFKAWHYPFVIMGFFFIVGGSITHPILGCLTGHLWHFIQDIIPRKYPSFKPPQTPNFIMDFFDTTNVTQPRFARSSGHRLGSL